MTRAGFRFQCLLVFALALAATHAEARHARGGGSAGAIAAPTLSIGASQIAESQFANTLTTPAMTTQASGSTCVVAVLGPLVADIQRVTDSKGNTYPSTPISVLYNSGSFEATIWIAPNCVGGSGHTFTVTMTASTFVSLTLIPVEVKASSGFAVVDESGTSPNLLNTTSAATPSVTPTVNGEVVLSFLGGGNATATTITDATGFNNILQSFATGTSNLAIGAVGGKVQATAAVISDTFTIGSSTNAGTAIISFKPN
jgi:hypothetical protein